MVFDKSSLLPFVLQRYNFAGYFNYRQFGNDRKIGFKRQAVKMEKQEYKAAVITTAVAMSTRQCEKAAEEFETPLNELDAGG